MISDQEVKVLRFAVTKEKDVGEYRIRIYSQLDNYFKNMTSTEFDVVIFEQSDFDWSSRPTFDLKMATEVIAVGESRTFRPTLTIQENGWDYSLTVNLGRSNKFTRYSK